MIQAILFSFTLHHALRGRYGRALACLAPALFVTAYDWPGSGAFAVVLPIALSLALVAAVHSRWALTAGRVLVLALAASLAADACGANGVIDAGRSGARGFMKGWESSRSKCQSPAAGHAAGDPI